MKKQAPQPEPEAPKGPDAAESEDAAFRRTMAEGVRVRKEADAYVTKCTLVHAEAKEQLKQARARAARVRQEIEDLQEEETREYPLFPRFQPPPAAPGAAPAPDGPKPDVPSGPGATPLSQVDGFPVVAEISLGVMGIQTVAELGVFTSSGGRLSDVPKVGEAYANQAIDALARFWERHRKDADKGAA